MLCSIFLKNHTLSHVAETLSGYDLPAIFGRLDIHPDLFHDFRLGEALDALHGKTEGLYAEIVFRGLRAFQIVLKRLHLDTTTVSLYGSYDGAPQVLEAYKGQEVVERGFHWLKGPLNVAPVFLKPRERIDVLGFVYLIFMFVYAIVQREVRGRLAQQDATLPSPAGPRSNRPTAWGLFLLLEHLTIYRLRQGSKTQVFTQNFNKVQMEILERCG